MKSKIAYIVQDKLYIAQSQNIAQIT